MEKNRIKPMPLGNVTRMSYSRIEELLEMPDLIEVQKDSYNWFINEGLREAFRDISPITDFNGNLVLELIDFTIDSQVKYTIEECKERDATYASPLRVKTRLRNRETSEIKEQEIFMGEFPLMTETGTFIINGAERVIVSQLVRSPGIYYSTEYDKVGKKLLSATVIPNRGAWLEYETDSNDVFSVRVDRNRKVPVSVLLRSLGVGTDEEILEMFGEDPMMLATLEKDVSKSREEGLVELYKRLRPGEPPTVESSEGLFNSMFFDPKRYDLARVGRYKYNKKLALKNRVKGRVLAENAIDPGTGEVIAEAGQTLSAEMAEQIQDSGAAYIWVWADDEKSMKAKVLSNLMVNPEEYLGARGLSPESLGIKGSLYYPALTRLLEEYDNPKELELAIRDNMPTLTPKHITREDIFTSVNYIIGLTHGMGNTDDIDHLGNRRIRSVGELLQNQFRIGLTRMERVVRERMTTQDADSVTPQALINIRPVTAAIKEFFGSSQLSQFMDQTNPLSELANKRRLSALGPGGISRDRASFEVRDVHDSHYGRMCPIETPEGPNIGLINSLASYARINEYGFIEAPYRVVDKTAVNEKGEICPHLTEEFIYVTADEEETYIIAQANAPVNDRGEFVTRRVSGRHKDAITEFDRNQIDLMDVSPKMLVSVATALIPFLENDDVTRALMGSNMQRQAVPLLKSEAPIIGTGMEYKAAKDSGVVLIAKNPGKVIRVTADRIVVKNDEGDSDIYKLAKFARSNQGTCVNQNPLVSKGERVAQGQVIADGPSTKNGELALGRNPLIGFMTWEGYNYEDAILLNEQLVQDDVYTSIHIEEYEAEARDTKLGPEEITRDIPNVGEDALKDLDIKGIIRKGAEVQPNDILVGKVTPKGETELTAEERLLRAIFGEKAREVRDTSLRVPHGESGIVVDVKVYTRDDGKSELPPSVNQCVKVYIAQKRKISVGDKMAGRHGNKGVISRILPAEDMPFLPNGKPLDIVLNPLGVPSRMNIGQVLEVHLGLAAEVLGFSVATPVFDGANEIDIMDTLDLADDFANMEWEDFETKWREDIDDEIFAHLEANKARRDEWRGVPINRDGKIYLRDGRSGELFDNPITVGYMHYLKLHHLVDDKIHSRSTGPYSLVTQQPLGGKAQFGGQRFGEMEVWALEAYGASYTLQEILTVKSDDISGRVKTYEAIVKGENIPEPGIPESFKVLLKELQALSLDVQVLLNDGSEVQISERIEDVDDLNVNIEGFETREDRGPRRERVAEEPPVRIPAGRAGRDVQDDDDNSFVKAFNESLRRKQLIEAEAGAATDEDEVEAEDEDKEPALDLELDLGLDLGLDVAIDEENIDGLGEGGGFALPEDSDLDVYDDGGFDE